MNYLFRYPSKPHPWFIEFFLSNGWAQLPILQICLDEINLNYDFIELLCKSINADYYTITESDLFIGEDCL